jgi:hypothetical protein
VTLSLLLLTLLASCLVAPATAQPTFSSIILQDQAPLDLAVPLPTNIAAEGSIYITRTTLAPGARRRLAAALGYEHVLASDEFAPGPVILSLNELGRIPGDRTLRGAIGAGIAILVLGLGAGVDESIAAARGEPELRCVLVGPNATAQPPAGWQRLGAEDARPVVWTHEVEVEGDHVEAGRRRFAIRDDGPPLQRLDAERKRETAASLDEELRSLDEQVKVLQSRIERLRRRRAQLK